MQFVEILKHCTGQTVIINNNEERTLTGIEEDFIILTGGNTQMKITDFVPVSQIAKVIRADYATGGHSISIDLTYSAGDMRRSQAH